MSADDTDGTTRRDLLKTGGLLGAGLALGLVDNVAANNGDASTSASVGAVQGSVYQWSDGPDGNGYTGPNSGRSNVSPNTGDVYIGWDSGAEKLFRGDGSSWVELADFSNIGTSSGGSGYAMFAAVVKDNGTSVDVEDFAGSSSTTSYSNVSDALNQLATDYDGNLAGNDPLGANIYVQRGEYSPNATIDLTQGVGIVGPRMLYSRDPSSASGREYLAQFDVANMPADSSMFRMNDASVPNGAQGAGVYGVDIIGNGHNNNTVTGIEFGTAGRNVAQLCVIANLGGDGILANDSFSSHVIDCAIRDCGVYSEDGSGNENGTNGIRTTVTDQNVNLKVGGTFVIQGPGAGTSNPASDIPSAVRSESGASVGMLESGGRRSGVKVHSGAATAAGIKGEDLVLRNITITGEGSAAAGVWMKGGRLVAQGGEWEKMRDLVYLENNFTGGVSKLQGIYFDSANADGGGGGNAIRVPSGGSGGVPTIDGCVFINLDRSAVRIEDGGGAARITGGEMATIATSGTGYVVEDNRTSPGVAHQVINTDTDGSEQDIINDWSLMGAYLGTQSNAQARTTLGETVYSNAVAGDLVTGEVAFDDNRGGTGSFALLKKDSAGTVHYWDAGGTL